MPSSAARALGLLLAAAGALGGAAAARADAPLPGFERRDVEFPCSGLRCAAWLYLPRGAQRPPVVVMAHGFAGTRELFLPRYAEFFAERGLAAFVFDYRRFGASQGEPRQLLRVADQLADWSAALDFVGALPDVDGSRVAIWGTSFSGGHVIATAADRPALRGVVAQVPFVDGEAGAQEGFGYRAHAACAILADWSRSLVGLAPHYVPVIGPAGTFAALASPSAYAAFQALAPPGLGWRNELAARSLLEVGRYRPILRAKDVTVPLFLIAAREDELIPLASVEAAAAQAPHARVERIPGGHFGVYASPLFERVAALEMEFLAEQFARDR